MKKTLLFLAIVLSATAQAEWQDTIGNAYNKAKEGTLSGAKKAYEGAKDIVAPVDFDKKAKELMSGRFTSSDEKESTINTKKEHFDAIWSNLLEKMNSARDIHDEIAEAPNSSWIKADKKSLNKDFNKILDQIIILLEDESIEKHRTKNIALREAIRDKELQIQTYQEERISAPTEDPIKTTKSAYDQKIKNAQNDLVDIHAEIEKINDMLAVQLNNAGLKLNKEQISVLLSRVDSDDIIQMVVVFDVLKIVTTQLMELTSNSGENIAHAKKYYGMHMVLLEAVVYMQNKYISQINEKYGPRLADIISKTEQLKQTTKDQIASEGNDKRRSIYQSNLKAQDLLIKTANLYLAMLNHQKEKVAKAKNNAVKDLNLAINTYATVRISSEMLKLLKESNNIFDALMNLQVPEIVPFENVEMQKKFEELSHEISK